MSDQFNVEGMVVEEEEEDAIVVDVDVDEFGLPSISFEVLASNMAARDALSK
jgi:hypothetical protein